MGTIILSIAFIIEVGIAAYCIITKSNQKKFRSIIRIITLGSFIVFTLTSILRWSFRWYGFTLLLFIWSILGVWILIHNKEDKGEYKQGRIVRRAISAFILIVLTLVPALVFPQYKLPKTTGNYKVESTVYTYTDINRIETFSNNNENRNVTVKFWFPQNANDTYPLVVFSHGSFGIGMSNESTYMELANNGYVVCSISHTYHSMYTMDTDHNIILVNAEFMKEVTDVNNGVYDEESIYELFKKWEELRTSDINFVLDTIIENANSNDTDEVYHLINIDKIGVFGHSLGGSAVSAIARQRSDISAVVNLDAPLFGELIGFQDGNMEMITSAYPVPLLNIYSDDLWEERNQWDTDFLYIPNFLLLSDTPADIYNVNFKGAKHLSFTDLPLVSPILSNILQGGKAKIDKYYCIETMNSTILSFFDYYLKGVGSFNPAETY